MSKKILVQTTYNWADEADFPSFSIIKEERLNLIKQEIREYFDTGGSTITVSVGTNEEIEFDDYGDIFSKYNYSECELTKEEAKALKKFFGKEYGGCSLMAVYEKMEVQDDDE